MGVGIGQGAESYNRQKAGWSINYLIFYVYNHSSLAVTLKEYRTSPGHWIVICLQTCVYTESNIKLLRKISFSSRFRRLD
jgi:hypothetical protein